MRETLAPEMKKKNEFNCRTSQNLEAKKICREIYILLK